MSRFSPGQPDLPFLFLMSWYYLLHFHLPSVTHSLDHVNYHQHLPVHSLHHPHLSSLCNQLALLHNFPSVSVALPDYLPLHHLRLCPARPILFCYPTWRSPFCFPRLWSSCAPLTVIPDPSYVVCSSVLVCLASYCLLLFIPVLALCHSFLWVFS